MFLIIVAAIASYVGWEVHRGTSSPTAKACMFLFLMSIVYQVS